MLTIAGIILFTLLWAFAFSGLFEAIAPLKKQMKKNLGQPALNQKCPGFTRRPQY